MLPIQQDELDDFLHMIQYGETDAVLDDFPYLRAMYNMLNRIKEAIDAYNAENVEPLMAGVPPTDGLLDDDGNILVAISNDRIPTLRMAQGEYNLMFPNRRSNLLYNMSCMALARMH